MQHPAFSTVDRSMPLESVFRESAVNKDFWEHELEKPAIYEKLDGERRSPHRQR